MSRWGRDVPKHTHRGAHKALNFAMGVALGVGAVLGAKHLQAPADAPQPAPEATQPTYDLSQPHIVSVELDPYGTGENGVAIAAVEQLREELYQNTLSGLPEHLRTQLGNDGHVRAFTDGIVDDHIKRLPRMGEAFAASLRLGNTQENRLLCVATGLSKHHTAQDVLHTMTGLKFRDTATPLSVQSLQDIITEHEFSHCFTAEMNAPVVRETLSDSYALARHLQKSGGDMRVPELYRDVRYAGLMNNASASHATAPFLQAILPELKAAYQAGELNGLEGADLMDKVKGIVLGTTPEQENETIRNMVDTSLRYANAVRTLRQDMYINPYTCRMAEQEGSMVILDEGSPEYRLLEAHQNAVDNICGRSLESRPPRAALYEQDLQELLEGRSPEEQAKTLQFQQWKLGMAERQMQQDGTLARQQARDSYGLRIDERRATLEKVMERHHIEPTPQPMNMEPSV